MGLIFSRHHEWIKLARYFGADDQDVDDVVQNFYLKIAEIEHREGSLMKITHHSGGLNSIYIFKIIQTCAIDQKRDANRRPDPDDPEDEFPDPEAIEIAYSNLMGKIKNVIDQMNEYDIMMLELHFVYGHSMREIEKRTGIPTHSVFNTLKNAKQKIKSESDREFKAYCQTKNEQIEIAGTWRYDRADHEGDGD